MSRPLVVAGIAVAIAAASLLAPAVPRGPSTPVAPAPAPAGLAKAFAGISAADRAVVAGLYDALATAVEKDDTLVTSTKVLADGVGRALDLAFDGRKPSADGSLGEAIDNHLAAAMGFHGEPPDFKASVPDVIVTPSLRAKIVAGLREIASAAR